jgi:hypothetical protein
LVGNVFYILLNGNVRDVLDFLNLLCREKTIRKLERAIDLIESPG